ncbi:MAG: hypothetical protein ACTINV_12430, partial [Cellulosimicrobium funkei]
ARPALGTDDAAPVAVQDGPVDVLTPGAHAPDAVGGPALADGARRRRPWRSVRAGSSATAHRAASRRPRTRPSHRREETSA